MFDFQIGIVLNLKRANLSFDPQNTYFGRHLAEIIRLQLKIWFLKFVKNWFKTGYRFWCMLDKANNAHCCIDTLDSAFFFD